MKYNKIVNPETGIKVNSDSKLGKQIINNYLLQLGGDYPVSMDIDEYHPTLMDLDEGDSVSMDVDEYHPTLMDLDEGDSVSMDVDEDYPVSTDVNKDYSVENYRLDYDPVTLQTYAPGYYYDLRLQRVVGPLDHRGQETIPVGPSGVDKL